MMSKPVAAAAALILAAAAGPLYAAAPAGTPAPRTFSQSLAATGLSAVHLVTGVGDVHVTGAATDKVTVTVSAEAGQGGHFIFNWTSGPSGSSLPAGLHLVTARAGQTLTIRLAGASNKQVVVTTPSGGRGITINGSGWKAQWHVVLPARLALTLDGDVGSADVRGIRGGLTAKLSVGTLTATLPAGPVSADVGVGKISADVGSPDYGDVSLTAGVGDVAFTVRGSKVETGYEHHITAGSQHVTGPGTTRYRLAVGTGHVELNLGSGAAVQSPGSSGSGAQGGEH